MIEKSKNQEKILNYNLRTLEINEICPNSIDGVVVSIEDGKRRLDLPSNMSSEVFRKWLGGKGGVFSQDISNFLKKKTAGIYILLEGREEGERSIIRLVDEEEFIAFDSRKLINGKIKDKAYMTLRVLKDGESLTTSSGYIEKNPEISELELGSEFMNIPHSGEDSLIQSIQLFSN
jgi:hypothetical protein